MTGVERIPIVIPIGAHLHDHVFGSGAVLPAVEAMECLARTILASRPGIDVTSIAGAEYLRFLDIPEGGAIDAFAEIEEDAGGRLIARLVTTRKSPNFSITRPIEHARVAFGPGPGLPPPPREKLLGLEGICMEIAKDRLYRELVPFGPSYRNVERLLIARDGAIALVGGGGDGAPQRSLGSPFPLDASFHAACAWGQRYRGIVGFPVSIGSRSIVSKTAPGETFVARVIFRGDVGGALSYDIWLIGMDGAIREEVLDLRMRDVSGGSLTPPAWIAAGDEPSIERIREQCAELAVIELATVTPAVRALLSPPEAERIARMREKRATSFCAARLALKKIARRLSGSDDDTPPECLTTVEPDGRPRCPATGGPPHFCSASHDSRFAVAAAADAPIGIDVEEITPRVLEGWHLFMHDGERTLAGGHPLGATEAAARIWTVKEAAGKAFGLDLADAWKMVEVEEVGEHESAFTFGGRSLRAHHAIIEGHVFTIVGGR